MSTQAIQKVEPKEIQTWKSPQTIKARIQAIQDLMNDVLKKDLDYGIIPGMPKGTKPSLWKPGSEQILAMFQIAVEPTVEDLSTDDCYRYRVITRLTNVQTGDFLGAGVGEASTDETKYKWRRTYSKPEFEGTPADRRRIKYGRYKDSNGMWTETQEMQVRQEPADLANTILKMAKKRSQIDATLTVTGASSMFEQDLEDLSDETREEMASQAKGRGKPVGDVMCASCGAINGHLPSCKHRKPDASAVPLPQDAKPEAKAPQTTPKPPEAPQKPENKKIVVKVQTVEERHKDLKDKAGNVTGKQTYLVLGVLDNENNEWNLYVWDAKLHERIKAAGNKVCVIEYSEKKSGTRTYCSLEAILEVMGEQPSIPSAAQAGFQTEDENW